MNFLTLRDVVVRCLVLVLFGLFGVVAGPQAFAQQINFTPTSLAFSPGGPYTVPRDKGIGSVLATASTAITANGVTCDITENVTVTGSELSPGIFTTGVAGIGVSFYVVPVSGSGSTLVTSSGYSSGTISAPGTGSLPGILANLIVTGQVASGNSLSSLPMATVTFSGSCLGGGSASQGLQTTVSNSVVTPITCTVNTQAISVALPTVSVSALSSVGSTSGNTRFNIGLYCQSGANVYVTLTDATTPTNTGELLTLITPDSTAGGVKLRILKSDGSAVSFGPDSAVAGTTNQWLVGPSSSTSNIPLMVQYYRDGQTLTPGKVKAAATFTMSYQ